MTFSRTWTVFWVCGFFSVRIQSKNSKNTNNQRVYYIYVSNSCFYCPISNTFLLMVILLMLISFILSFLFHSFVLLTFSSCTNRVESTSSSQLPSAPESNRNYYNATNNQEYNNPTQFNSYFSVYDDEADDAGDLYRDGKHSFISSVINIYINV